MRTARIVDIDNKKDEQLLRAASMPAQERLRYLIELIGFSKKMNNHRKISSSNDYQLFVLPRK